MKLKDFMQRLEVLCEEIGYNPEAEIIIVPDKGGIGYNDVKDLGMLRPCGRGIYVTTKMGDVEKF